MKFKAFSNKDRELDLNWDRINIHVALYKPNTPFDIEITRRQAKKSDPLRKYFFGAVLPPILEQSGYEKDEALELHRWLKIRFFQVPVDKKWGIHRDKDIPSVFSDDSDLPVSEKKKYVDYVIRKAAKVDIYIPDPGRN